MKKYVYRLMAVCALSSILIGCSSDDAALQPAPLPVFKQTANPDYLWSMNITNGVVDYYLELEPVIVGNTVFTVAYNGTMMASNVKNGKVLWQTHSSKRYIGGVTAADGNLFVSTDDAKLVSVSQATGRLNWIINSSSQALAPATVVNQTLLVHAIDGTVTAYAENTGAQLWQYQQEVPDLVLHLTSQPQVSGQYVVCGFSNGKVAAMDLTSGKAIWERQIAEPEGATVVSRMVDIDLNPIIRNGIVYIAGYQGKVVALNLNDGATQWSHPLSAYSGTAADAKAIYISDSDSNIWAFDQQTGTVLWKQSQLLRRGLTGPVLLDNNMLAVADNQGYVHFLSTQDGHFVARKQASLSPILATPVYMNGVLYVYSQAGRLALYKI